MNWYSHICINEIISIYLLVSLFVCLFVTLFVFPANSIFRKESNV